MTEQAHRIKQSIRSYLSELRRIDPDPANDTALPLVSRWVEEFFDLLPLAHTNDSQCAYWLVVAWARLWRTDKALIGAAADRQLPAALDLVSDRWSELLRAAGTREREHEETLLARIGELVRAAVSVPNPLQWTTRLEALTEETDEEEELELVELMQSYDEMELCAWAAGRFAPNDPAARRFRRCLSVARAAVVEHASTLAYAKSWIRPLALSIDLEPPERSLLQTVQTLPAVLQEVVRLERLAHYEPVSQAAATLVVRYATAVHRQWLAVQALARLVRALVLARQTREKLAAAAQDVPVAEDVTTLRWLSPDRRYLAAVESPVVVGESNVLVVRVRLPRWVEQTPYPGPPAVGLGGVPIRLAGVESVLDEEGSARFDPAVIQMALEAASAASFEAKIGSDWSEWMLVPNGPESQSDGA